MSADTDLAEEREQRDLHLAGRLGQLPPPAPPPGLAARIVANAARLPQDRDEPVETVAVAPVVTPQPEHRRWRWLPHAIGTAIAASVVAALFLQQSPDPAPRTTETQVAYKAPAPLPQDQPADIAAVPARERDRMAAAAPTMALNPKLGEHAGKPSDGPAPLPAIEPAPPTAIPPNQDQALELAAQQQGPANNEEPAAQAFVGPPAIDDHGPPMLQSDPVSGLGISGIGATPPSAGPPSPGPGPAPRSGRGGPMPRF